jgi:putative hemolysin
MNRVEARAAAREAAPMESGSRSWTRGVAGIVLIAAWAAALAACASTTPGPAPAPTRSSAAADDGSAACADHGGTVQSRQPTFGTNNDPSSWVPLGDPVDVCRFQTLGDSDDSRIYVDLVSISSTRPTLAALAYLARTPLPEDATGNPANALCTSLGGAVDYGSGADGGGLVNQEDPDDVVFAPCVFADGSFIEEWGIAYYSNGTVRGIDLSKVFAFDQSDLPSIAF